MQEQVSEEQAQVPNGGETPQTELKQEVAEVTKTITVEDEEVEVVAVDFSTYSQKELVEQLSVIKRAASILSQKEDFFQIHEIYYARLKESEKEALERFLEEGGTKDSFEYRLSDADRKYKEYTEELFLRLKKEKNEDADLRKKNTAAKKGILDELRALVQGDVKGENFRTVRDIQDRWRSHEPVQSKERSELWSNYRALLDIFYNNHNLLDDLRDLDRKKNFDKKLALCEKAEKLVTDEPMIKEAFRKFNVLNQEFRSIGPVEESAKEEIVKRFYDVVGALKKRQEEWLEGRKVVMAENLEKRKLILEEVIPFTEFSSDRINDWRAKSDELNKVQDKWKAAYPVSDAGEGLSKEFWKLNKVFFANKSEFFGKLDDERKGNWNKKKDLIEEVKALQADTEKSLDQKINEVKGIQANWKNIGAAPRKVNDKIFAEFRKLCNSFFEQRDADKAEKEKEYAANYDQKVEVLNELGKVSSEDVAGVAAKLDEYEALGLVPREKIKEHREAYDKVTGPILKNLPESEADLKWRIKLLGYGKEKGDREIGFELKKLQKNLKKMEVDYSNLELNMERFGAALLGEKGAEELKKLEQQIVSLKQEIKILRKLS